MINNNKPMRSSKRWNMESGYVQIYCGEGRGKTTAAIGQGIRAASQGKSVIIIQFLKGKNEDEISFIKKLEPEIKLFSFEKSDNFFEELSKEEQSDEIMNIRNGLNFANKVLLTGECNVLILDEVLGLLDNGIISIEDIKNLTNAKDQETELILTGRFLNDELVSLADEVSRIETVKTKVDNHI